MTGVEAVSNGVKAFREPAVDIRAPHAYRHHRNPHPACWPASRGWRGFTASAPPIPARRAIRACSPAHRRRRRQGLFYYVSIGSILLVLALSANTAFADFPRLCRAIAHRRLSAAGLSLRGRRLVYSQGIYVLAFLAAVLLIDFGGVTDRLIPLFAVGAFLAFTLSQAAWWCIGGA